jgi:hypothetical protein
VSPHRAVIARVVVTGTDANVAIVTAARDALRNFASPPAAQNLFMDGTVGVGLAGKTTVENLAERLGTSS